MDFIDFYLLYRFFSIFKIFNIFNIFVHFEKISKIFMTLDLVNFDNSGMKKIRRGVRRGVFFSKIEK